MSAPAAVLFDMDGLLVDTEVVWYAVLDEAMARRGGRWVEADQLATLGAPLETTARYILARCGADGPQDDHSEDGSQDGNRWTDLADELIEAMVTRVTFGVDVRPGALELLDALAAAGVRCALVSNSQRALVDAVLGHVGAERFDVSVSATEVARPKPDPEPYLTAAGHLGVAPGECVVLEDSVPGSTAGLAAGCAVLVVPTLPGLPFDPQARVVGSLLDVDLDLLGRLRSS